MPCGMGIDLRSFGRIQVNRVSDIMFDAAVQLYYVKFVAGPLKGETLGTLIWHNAFGQDIPDGLTCIGGNLYFDSYEDAVDAEVEVLIHLRMQGVF